jgi:hypothetical protein
MRINIRRALAGVAAFSAAASVGLITASPAFAAPLAPNAPPTAQAGLAPAPGVNLITTPMAITLPSNGGGITQCLGTGTAGYRQRTFVMNRSTTVTPAAIQYTAVGATSGGNAAITYVGNLWTNTGGAQLISANPSTVPAGLIPNSYSLFLPQTIPAGEYWVGIACSFGTATDGDYWSAPVTVTAAGWQSGWAPSAPVLSSPLTAGDTTLAGTFTAQAGLTALDVLYTPSGGSQVTQSLSTSATSFSLTGLTNGTSYAVQIRATNGIGSTLSNIVNGTPSLAPRNPVSGFTAVGITTGATLNWSSYTATPAVPAHTGFSITAAPAGGSGTPSCSTPGAPIAGSPFSVASPTATTFTVNALTAGTLYCFTIVPVFPGGVTAPPAATQASALGSGVIQQTISVVRPAGALKLTQRCGVTDGWPATTLDAATGFPGFPAITQTAPAPILTGGTPPTVVTAAPGNTTAVGAPDNQFGDYPDPATQTRTNCDLDLGTAKLILTGSYKGQFYAASGAISQLSVLDTRNTDQGWTINGTMGTFVNGSFNFSGAYLGWQPRVSSTTSSPTYTQVVNAGGVVNPDPAGVAGLAAQTPLAISPAPTPTTGGLGLATLDARVNLLIPVTRPSGTYTGVLTFSAL